MRAFLYFLPPPPKKNLENETKNRANVNYFRLFIHFQPLRKLKEGTVRKIALTEIEWCGMD
jgi:hypothetical protein